MRVLLITPENPHVKAFRRGQLNNFAQLTMPYLSAFVKPPDEVSLIDEYNQTVDFDTPADLVGVTCNTPNATHVYRMAEKFRERGRLVVLGGPHVTLMPEEAKPHADAVVVGEAEETWPVVLADARGGVLQPEYRASCAPSLHGLPQARRELIHHRGFLAASVFATRGCPHRCHYCNLRQIYDPMVRFRPPEEVAAEVRSLRSPTFAFWDDQLFLDPHYSRTLFRALEPIGKTWAAMVTLSSVRDDDFVRAAARAGCVCLFLGLESFSEESLRSVNKGFNRVEAYKESVDRLHRHGILVQAGLIFGFDGDDETVFGRTLDATEKVGIDGATISILTPFPRTPLFDRLEREGRLLTRDWSYYNGKTAVSFRPAQMSPERLWEGYMWFRQQFFSPVRILRRVSRSRVQAVRSVYLNWGYRRTLRNRLPGKPIPVTRNSGRIVLPGSCGTRREAPEEERAPAFKGVESFEETMN